MVKMGRLVHSLHDALSGHSSSDVSEVRVRRGEEGLSCGKVVDTVRAVSLFKLHGALGRCNLLGLHRLLGGGWCVGGGWVARDDLLRCRGFTNLFPEQPCISWCLILCSSLPPLASPLPTHTASFLCTLQS